MQLQCMHYLIKASSIEPCLSAQSINLAQSFGPNVRIPVDCQCSTTDLICINLQIYNTSSDANGLTLPTLSVLFDQSFSSLYYILPKQRFSFFGYKYMVPEAFSKVKFVNDYGVSKFNDQTIFIDVIEGNFFPTGTFDSFGNLNKFPYQDWPRVFVNIVINEENPLYMVRNAISNVSIETLTFSYKQSYLNSRFFLYSLTDSKIKNLIFKNSKGFTGFTECDYPQLAKNNKLGIAVEHLLIDQSPNFILNESTIPPFDGLYSLSITSSMLTNIPKYSFINLKSLASLNLNGNVLTQINADSFDGIEGQLVHIDISHNPLVSMDWNIFQKFNRLRILDLSYTNISTIDSNVKIWPRSNDLTTINLAGYSFNTLSICSFDSNPNGQRLNFSKTLIQLDQNQECNCFVFYVYKDYRLNPLNNPSYWISTNSTPQCYRNFYYANPYSPNFNEIERREKECDFNFILNTICEDDTPPTLPTIYPILTTSVTPVTGKKIVIINYLIKDYIIKIKS